uniref:Mitochondrial carrier homolog 1 n=1 Tax=Rhinopithecus roxellana TaxID=61622 RepID=A0A2K6RFV2_RHIRO
MDGGSGGLGSGDNAPTTEALFVALGAGVTALSHPLLYVKLLIQVGHEPMPPTLGTNVLGRKVLYLPSFFTYAKYIVQVDGKIGLFRGLSPRLMSNALSTVTRGSMKKVFPPDEIEQVSNKDDMKTSLKKVVKETSYEMMMQCVSRMLAHPLHVISMRCMVQFVGREAKYSGVLSSIGKIFKEEGLLGFFVGLIPHLLGDVVFLWGCNLLAHFINAYLVDDSFSQALAIRSYTKFVMGIAVSMLTYPFLLVGDLMAVNNCGLQAGLPPYSPVFKSWIHCWKYLSVQAPACFSAGCHQDHALPWSNLNHLKNTVSTWPPWVRPDHLGTPARRLQPNNNQMCSSPARLQFPYLPCVSLFEDDVSSGFTKLSLGIVAMVTSEWADLPSIEWFLPSTGVCKQTKLTHILRPS